MEYGARAVVNPNPSPVDTSTSPYLKLFNDSLANMLEKQKSTILRIDSKMHDLMNLRTPPAPTEPPKEKSGPDDFCSFCDRQIDFLKENNKRLEQIEEHLNRVI